MELEWGSIFGSHYKTSAGLDTFFFFCFLSSFWFFLSEMKKQLSFPGLSFSACSDECRAANPGLEEDDGKGPANISNMLRCPGPALCSAFLLVLKCIAYQERVEARWGLGIGEQGGVLSYSGDELTLLCKRRKMIWSLISSPTPNIFDEEIKSNTYEEHGDAECLLLRWWQNLT